MNLDTTHNRYSSIASPDEPRSESKRPIKGFLEIICIFFIVLGALGLLGTVQEVVSVIFVLFMDGKQFNPLTLFPGAMAISIGIAAVNCIVSVLEIMGGVVGLKQKRAGAILIRFVSAFMLVFKVAETAFASILKYLSTGPTIEQTIQQMFPEQANGPDIGMIVQIMKFVVVGITILFGLAMFTFYLFSFLTFSKQKTLSQFS